MIDRIYGATQSLLAMVVSDKPYTNIRVIIHETQSYSTNIENGATYPLQDITINIFSKDNKRSKSIGLFDINKALYDSNKVPLKQSIKYNEEITRFGLNKKRKLLNSDFEVPRIINDYQENLLLKK
jgi:hypothetical protein